MFHKYAYLLLGFGMVCLLLSGCNQSASSEKTTGSLTESVTTINNTTKKTESTINNTTRETELTAPPISLTSAADHPTESRTFDKYTWLSSLPENFLKNFGIEFWDFYSFYSTAVRADTFIFTSDGVTTKMSWPLEEANIQKLELKEEGQKKFDNISQQMKKYSIVQAVFKVDGGRKTVDLYHKLNPEEAIRILDIYTD